MTNHLKDLKGQRFGFLTVLELDKQKSNSNRKYWICKCDCGNIKSIRGDALKSKKQPTVSCGCYLKKRLHETHHYKDITGQRFGRLIAIQPIFKLSTQGKMYWKCKCDCGAFIQVINQDLFSGHTQSCGCLRSKGELKITQLLIKNNIPFERQKQFQNCTFSKKNTKPRFDFYVDNCYLIEYDGRQHYQSDNTGWNTSENLKQTQLRDAFKNKWCKDNGIPLIRIPYTHYDKLCIEDLLLESSTFLFN